MPPLPNAPSVVRVALGGGIGSAQFQNIFHLRYTLGAPTASECASIATAVADAWNTALASVHSQSCGLSTVTVIDLASNTGAEGVVNVTHPGTRVGTGFMAQVCCVVSWHVAMRWRGGHPRTYFPFGVVADTTGNHLWLDTARTAFAAATQNFMQQLNAIAVGGRTFRMVCVRYHSGHQLLADPIILDISSLTIHGRIDTQRRRLGKELV